MFMMPMPLKSLFSPHYAIRGAELALAVALALALADLAWLLLPGPGDKEQPALAVPGRGGAGANPVAAAGGATASGNLSPALLDLFGVVAAGGPATAFAADEVRETDLDLTLKGILARRGTARKIALVAQGDAGEKLYRLGDRVAGAEITHIEARRILLLRNGKREALLLETAAPRRGSSFNRRRATAGITMINERARVVPRNLLDRQMQRLPEVLGQARAAPYRDHNGLEAGFRIVDIVPDSVFDQLGLQQEDVIVSVNGVSVRNNQEALAAYQSFKSADALRLGLLRDGREVTIDFSIQ